MAKRGEQPNPQSYKQAGVDVEAADAMKHSMADDLETADPRVMNRLGPFASLFDARFPQYEHPVLVLKHEEPGSKQKLALKHGRVESICRDLIHHLINDIAVMGAHPLAVLDTVICGRLDPATVRTMVRAMGTACRQQGCTLVGGETSEQPGVLNAGTYVLTAGVVGVVERRHIVDGSRIQDGDQVLAVASNGLHTNGYSLVRALLEREPKLADRRVDGERMLEVLLRPHLCYYHALRGIYQEPGLHGMAHVTGGGIAGNLKRIMPDGLQADIALGRLRVLPVFRAIREAGALDDGEMLRTFNMGVGLCLVVAPCAVVAIREHLLDRGSPCYAIGCIAAGDQPVRVRGRVCW